MLDRSKCKVMEISNDGKNWDNKRIVIEIFKDNSCLAVDDIYFSAEEIEEFRQCNGSFGTTKYHHCREIKEPEKRLMTQKEYITWVVTTGYKNWVLRYENCTHLFAPLPWSQISDLKYLRKAPIDEKGNIGEWTKFEVEE